MTPDLSHFTQDIHIIMEGFPELLYFQSGSRRMGTCKKPSTEVGLTERDIEKGAGWSEDPGKECGKCFGHSGYEGDEMHLSTSDTSAVQFLMISSGGS